jgi:DNA-binding XRE family transcriptional regulator
MEIVKKLRKKLKVKQCLVAERLGIQRTNYNAIENGKLIPNNIDKIQSDALFLLKPVLLKRMNEVAKELMELEKLNSEL